MSHARLIPWLAQRLYRAKNGWYTFRCFSRAWASRKPVILVGCHVRHFTGNAFHFVNETHRHPNAHVVAVVTPAAIYPFRIASLPCVLKGSWWAHLLAKRAAACCGTEGPTTDIGNAPGQGMQVFLYHGMPIKGIIAQGKPAPWHWDQVDLVLATSPFTRRIMAKAFGVPRRRVAVTGEPKTDAFHAAPAIARLRRQLGEYDKVIAYLPTFRDAPGPARGAPDPQACLAPLLDLQRSRAVQNALARHRACMVVGLHPGIGPAAATALVPPYIAAGALTPHTEHLMAAADLVISDYSSVVIDALLLDAPLALFSPDLEVYRELRGFPYFDYERMFGPLICRTADDVARIMDWAFTGARECHPHQQRLRRLFHTHRDGRNSQRVVQEILSRSAASD